MKYKYRLCYIYHKGFYKNNYSNFRKTMKIQGEKQFQVMAHSFGISASAEGYVLNYSADGYSWTAWDEATPAGEVAFITGVPKGCYYKLVGNASEVIINF